MSDEFVRVVVDANNRPVPAGDPAAARILTGDDARAALAAAGAAPAEPAEPAAGDAGRRRRVGGR